MSTTPHHAFILSNLNPQQALKRSPALHSPAPCSSALRRRGSCGCSYSTGSQTSSWRRSWRRVIGASLYTIKASVWTMVTTSSIKSQAGSRSGHSLHEALVAHPRKLRGRGRHNVVRGRDVGDFLPINASYKVSCRLLPSFSSLQEQCCRGNGIWIVGLFGLVNGSAEHTLPQPVLTGDFDGDTPCS